MKRSARTTGTKHAIPPWFLDELVPKLVLGISAFVSIVGCILTYFWGDVVSSSNDYVQAVFLVTEVRPVRVGSHGPGPLLAVGKVGETEELVFSWRDYAGGRPAREIPAGETWPVMFNRTKGYTHFNGRNLRVLSLQDYDQAGRKLAGSVLLIANFPVLLLIRRFWKRALRPRERFDPSSSN